MRTTVYCNNTVINLFPLTYKNSFQGTFESIVKKNHPKCENSRFRHHNCTFTSCLATVLQEPVLVTACTFDQLFQHDSFYVLK